MKLWLAVLMLLCLTACVTTSGSAGLPATDLNELRSNVWEHLKPRTLDSGKTYCAEDATTERAQDTCMGALEDYAGASETDKAAGWTVFNNGMKRLELQRDPCNRLEKIMRLDRCRLPTIGSKEKPR